MAEPALNRSVFGTEACALRQWYAAVRMLLRRDEYHQFTSHKFCQELQVGDGWRLLWNLWDFKVASNHFCLNKSHQRNLTLYCLTCWEQLNHTDLFLPGQWRMNKALPRPFPLSSVHITDCVWSENLPGLWQNTERRIVDVTEISCHDGPFLIRCKWTLF